MSGPIVRGTDASLAHADGLSLADLLNRVLDRGVVVSGEALISVGGVDLVYLGLRLVLTSVEELAGAPTAPRDGDGERFRPFDPDPHPDPGRSQCNHPADP